MTVGGRLMASLLTTTDLTCVSPPLLPHSLLHAPAWPCPLVCVFHAASLHAQTHELQCERCPVVCPRGCGAPIVRGELGTHAGVCPLEPVACAVAGCGATLPRGEMAAHVAGALAQHLCALSQHLCSLTKVGPSLHMCELIVASACGFIAVIRDYLVLVAAPAGSRRRGCRAAHSSDEGGRAPS